MYPLRCLEYQQRELSFIFQLISDLGVRSVQVSAIESGSPAERCGFKSGTGIEFLNKPTILVIKSMLKFMNFNKIEGDVVLAVNNVPITNERQLSKLLSGTAGDLSVLVDRTIYEEDKSSLNTFKSDGKLFTERLGKVVMEF